jgi:isocitrate dehydrogenase kinase/phosphatase
MSEAGNLATEEGGGNCAEAPADALAAAAAETLAAAWSHYADRFRAATARAGERFERRDWRGAQADAAERLALYASTVVDAVGAVRSALGASARDRCVWGALRARYAERVTERPDVELAQTFFNSITRRVLGTVGLDAAIEFTDSRVPAPRRTGAPPPYRTHACGDAPGVAGALDAALVSRILDETPWRAPWADRAGDAERVAAELRRAAEQAWGAAVADAIDVLPAPFYRNKGAYVVARVRRGEALFPLVLAVLHDERGVYVDAALTTSDEASVVFGFSWSYFRVEAERPRATIEFLRTIMPLKRLDELYTALGHNKHGKTELFRTLRRHLEAEDARFAPAPGDEGLVMAVFTLPSLNVVFKVIRDSFAAPKRVTRREVRDRYHFVFVRDRAGRLADAQEFELLELPRRCFPDDLLAHLLDVCGSTIYAAGDRVVVRHCYTERRVTPLNLYLREADPDAAREAVLDYGRAIKELAATDIFTGDMLLKNFGVTRHGRVIFYDYDELATLTECRFRRLPAAAHPDDDLAAEPWFHVGEHDVFPEEFRPFLVPPPPFRGPFLADHSDLLDVAWWQGMQQRVAAGELFDVFPYKQSRRFRR